MVATRSARRRGTPLLALWRREDARATVVDFLPTRSIATLPFVAKPLREAQMPLLLTAVRRRCAKDSIYRHPPTAQDLLNNLLVGEPQHFCETWERGIGEWRRTGHQGDAAVKPFHGVGSCLELTGRMWHRGFARPLQAQNTLVKRYRVAMSYVDCGTTHTPGTHTPGDVAVGYALLCGPGAPTGPDDGLYATRNFIGGPRFDLTEPGVVSLLWFYATEEDNESQPLVVGVAPNIPYIVDARFNHEWVGSWRGTVDISVDGLTVVQGLPVVYNPLESINLYNWSSGISQIGKIDVWYEKARLNQTWKYDLGPGDY